MPSLCALCGVPHSAPAIRSPGFAGRRPFWHRRGVGHIPLASRVENAAEPAAGEYRLPSP